MPSPESPPPLVLASASPRRRQLLAALGVAFEVVPSSVDEVPLPDERPEAFARRAAREKAADVACHRPKALVLGADTIVVVGDALFGKPRDRTDAVRMLQALSGATHRVCTAVALIGPGPTLEETMVESRVCFRQLRGEEIEAYVDSGEPFDKAGAYAVQGRARAFVTRLDGSRSNVIGLPLDEVAEMLRRHLLGATSRLPSPP